MRDSMKLMSVGFELQYEVFLSVFSVACGTTWMLAPAPKTKSGLSVICFLSTACPSNAVTHPTCFFLLQASL